MIHFSPLFYFGEAQCSKVYTSARYTPPPSTLNSSLTIPLSSHRSFLFQFPPSFLSYPLHHTQANLLFIPLLFRIHPSLLPFELSSHLSSSLLSSPLYSLFTPLHRSPVTQSIPCGVVLSDETYRSRCPNAILLLLISSREG